jgi:hypothetical protein
MKRLAAMLRMNGMQSKERNKQSLIWLGRDGPLCLWQRVGVM